MVNTELMLISVQCFKARGEWNSEHTFYNTLGQIVMSLIWLQKQVRLEKYFRHRKSLLRKGTSASEAATHEVTLTIKINLVSECQNR